MSTSALSSGKCTAASSDAEVMKNVGRVQNRVHALLSEICDVRHSMNDLIKRGQPLDKNWVQNLRAREAETNELQNKFNETRRGGGTDVIKAFRKLYKKVNACLKAVVGLKREANHKIVALKVADSAIFPNGSLLHNGDGSSRSFESVLRHLAKGKPIQFSSGELSTYTNDFYTRLGSGGFGVVYKGQFPNGVYFAVKVLNATDAANKQSLAEVATMGRTYHRNLLRIYGYCSDKSMKAIVYEYMPNGSLAEVLQENHLNLEWKQIYSIVTDTAKGLSYLHDNCHEHIIHFDIKPANVLIDSDLCPKVGDFGLARQYKWHLSHLTLTGGIGTRGYAAPELFTNKPKGSCKCDVYSFGVLLFKALESKKNRNICQEEDQKWFPFEVLEQYKKGQLEKILRDCGIEDKKDRENATKLVLVAFCCIQKNPRSRPSMSTVVKTLEGEIPAKVPPNLVLPLMSSSSSVASKAPAKENIQSSTFSVLSARAGDSTTEEESNFLESWLSSETSPSSAERMHSELQYPVQKRMVEKKDIKPEVKKDEVPTVVLKVSMHCEDCALKIKKSLVKMEGVVSADPDLGNSLVTVKCFIEPNELVKHIWKKHKKCAEIVKPELGKKQEEKGVEHYSKKEDKKEEELGFVKTKSKMKREKQLDTVQKKSEAKGTTTEEKQYCIGETEVRREEGQVSIKKEERRTKSKKIKEENLGRVETNPERKDVAEMKQKKKEEEEEMETAKTELEKEKAKAKAERKRKGKEKIEEKKDMSEKKTKEEEENGNITEKNKGVGNNMATWARPEEELSNWRALAEMQNAFSDENSNTWACSIQ